MNGVEPPNIRKYKPESSTISLNGKFSTNKEMCAKYAEKDENWHEIQKQTDGTWSDALVLIGSHNKHG